MCCKCKRRSSNELHGTPVHCRGQKLSIGVLRECKRSAVVAQLGGSHLLYTWFHGPTWVSSPNGISNGSAVCAGLMNVTNTHRHTQTDRPRYSVCSNRPLSLASAAMRPYNNTNIQICIILGRKFRTCKLIVCSKRRNISLSAHRHFLINCSESIDTPRQFSLQKQTKDDDHTTHHVKVLLTAAMVDTLCAFTVVWK